MMLWRMVLIVLIVAGFGHSAGAPEYAVKAAYLFNFARFTEWPNLGAAANFTVCLYGKDPFGGFLEEAVRGKQAHGMPVAIRRVTARDEALESCQVLFFGNSAQLDPVLSRLRGQSILTVGESESFTAHGGMIGLVMDSGSVRFDLNLVAVAAAHLQVSSRLIEMGRVVGTKK